MNKKQKKNLIRIIIAAAMMALLHFVPAEGYLRLFLYLIPYLVVGYDILIKAWKGIKNRQPLDECLLMTIATLGALLLGIIKTGDYNEAVLVMLFYQVGEWFQSYAVGKSRRNITELMDIRPDYANIQVDGKIEKVDPDDVEVGTIIICQPGEKIPIDGIVIKGKSTLNTSALTGESAPRTVGEGEEVASGFINMTGVLEIETTKEFGESTASKILDLVENASYNKAKSEDFISKFARFYTPAVVISALALFLIPPLVRQFAMGLEPDWGEWMYRALTFLIISCPCALVISIPLSFFAGIGGASREGILIKGSNYLETLAKTRIMVSDKTGTLTKGTFEVVGVHHNKEEEAVLLEYAALAESASSHPISKSIKEAYIKTSGKELDSTLVKDIEEISGKGVIAKVKNKTVAVGNDKLMKELSVEYLDCHNVGTVIHIALEGEYAGHILIADSLKENSGKALEELKKLGVSRIVMLTGDDRRVAESIGESLGIKEIESELLPGDKVNKVETILKEKKNEEKLIFVGDGINDAPVLTRADVGIAMGALGSDAAIEAADVVLMDDDPLKIAKAIKIAKKTMRIVYENIYFAIGVKLICLILGAIGFAGMGAAIFADVGVMVIAVLNALRALLTK